MRPKSSIHHVLVEPFINVTDWDAAKWRATAFTYHYPTAMGHELPGIGIGFEDFAAGQRIFDQWIERVGPVDVYEELRISIIEGPIPCQAEGYTVFISWNPLHTIHRKKLNDPDFNTTKFLRVSRLNRMEPAPNSPHLRLFKTHFALVQKYRLFPVRVTGSQMVDMDFSRAIEKQELNLLQTANLKPEELEYAAYIANY